MPAVIASGPFGATLRRELCLAARQPGDWANPLVFFVIAITLIPLAVGPEREALAAMAPGIVWVMALLATLLPLDGLFREDREDGSLDQALVSPALLYWVVLAKVIAHWLVTGLPLALLSPLLGLMMALPAPAFTTLVASLVVGSLTMALIGAVGAALTAGLRRGGLVLSLITMPLYVPVLIFGAGAVNAAANGAGTGLSLAILGALGSLALVLAPLAAGAALRIGADSD